MTTKSWNNVKKDKPERLYSLLLIIQVERDEAHSEHNQESYIKKKKKKSLLRDWKTFKSHGGMAQILKGEVGKHFGSLSSPKDILAMGHILKI